MIEDARDELAAIAATFPMAGALAPLLKLVGYREPQPTLVMPCLIVLDPERIDYAAAYGGIDSLTFRCRLVAPYTNASEAARPLDRLLDPAALPLFLRKYTGPLERSWSSLALTNTLGPYTVYETQDRTPIGIAADVSITLKFP